MSESGLSSASCSSAPTVEEVEEKAASMARLVDHLLRGRVQPSAKHEAAAALSCVRAFVRACRPTPQKEGGTETAQHRKERRSDDASGNAPRPSPPGGTLLKLAQRGVQLHNNARKLPQLKARSGTGGGGEWKAAAVAYLRAVAASLVSLGSTTSPKDCANLCRLFSKAGDMLVEEAGDDIRALEMFDDAEEFFGRLPESFYGGGQGSKDRSERLSLSVEDLIMAMHKASTRRIEVLSRTTGNVNQMVYGYEQQLKMLKRCSPAGLSLSIAMHAASIGEETFKKGDYRGSARLLRTSLLLLGGDLGEPVSKSSRTHLGLRRTTLFSLAYCYGQSEDHRKAVQCMKQLEDEERHVLQADADTAQLLFAKCKVLADAGDLAGAQAAAESLALVEPKNLPLDVGTAASEDPTAAVVSDLELVAARMVASKDNCSDKSLALFSKIAARHSVGPKAIAARISLLDGLAKAVRMRSEGCGVDRDIDVSRSSSDGTGVAEIIDTSETEHDEGATKRIEIETAVQKAKKTADELVADHCKGGSCLMSSSQLQETLEILVALAEFFQDCEEWDACAAWCERAILLATSSKTNGPYGSALRGEEATHAGNVPSGESSEAGGAAGPPLLASLLTLKGEMECRMEDFASSRQTLDKALALCPSNTRAREVAFWSTARDPNCDESSLSARLSALLGPRSSFDSEGRREFLASCAALVAGTIVARAGGQDAKRTVAHRIWDDRLMMVQERWLETILESPSRTQQQSEVDERNDAAGDDDGCIRQASTSDGGCGVIPMDVAGELTAADRAESAGVLDELLVTPSRKRRREGGAQRSPKPGAVQIVASMVDRALQPQATQTVVEAQRETHAVSTVGESFLPGNTGNEKWMVADRSVLSRVLLSVDKALASAPLLEINLRDEADIHFLAQACWNLAVRCCGPKCDLPWALELHVSSGGGLGGDEMMPKVQETSDGDANENDHIRTELLELARAFFRASRQWNELRSEANSPESLLSRQNCMMLGVAAALELSDSKEKHNSESTARGNNVDQGSSFVRDTTDDERSRRLTLERCRKDLEIALGLNRLLSEVQHESAREIRSVLLVAEISVLSRLRDAAAVRSLVSGRESDLMCCSTKLLHYCIQLVNDTLEDPRSTAGLSRICIRRCAEEDPVDVSLLGGLYRRLLLCALNREDALLVVDEFSVRVKELEEGPRMPPPDVDYMAAKCYNIGLQLLEMSRATEAERFVGKALGLVRIGASKAFSARWAEAMHRVYRAALLGKGNDNGTGPGQLGGPTPDGLRSGGAAFHSTGLFPMPASATHR